MNKEIYLIRHGETTWNTKKMIQGQLDSSLTENGIKQSNKLATRMQFINPDIIFTSNLSRATETAQIINTLINKEIVPKQAFKERNWGVFQGTTWQKVKNNFPKEYKYYRNDTKHYVIPNGESYNQVFKRAMECLEELVMESKYEKVVIVTHGGVISLLIRELLSLPYDSYRKLLISNSSITKLIYNDYGFSITTIGDTAHLEY